MLCEFLCFDVAAPGPGDLLSGDFEPEEPPKDDMALLNEILNAPVSEGDDFTKEWQAVFGSTPIAVGANYTPGEPDQSRTGPEFMPSNLLDMSSQMAAMSLAAQGQGQFKFWSWQLELQRRIVHYFSCRCCYFHYEKQQLPHYCLFML